ncbi:MAG TPA: hypothetical protein VJ276_15735 [Thermoanaerobaculia bacterium]|nr:hypothetical protein [Thermoanaerobaculia bacterium]
MNRTRAGLLALAAFALAAPLAQAAEKPQASQPQPAATVGTSVETPQLQILPPELSAFYASIAAHNRVKKLANGAKSMDFEGGMIMVAKLDANGKMQSTCVDSEGAARRFLETKAPLARIAEEK